VRSRLLIISVVSVLVVSLGVNAASSAREFAGSNGMKIALEAHAIADARRLTVRWHDLWRGNTPNGWVINAQSKPGVVNRTGPALLRCQGHVADFASFTFRGGWTTRFDRGARPVVWQLTSSTIVLATRAQAQHYFDLLATWNMRYCMKSGATFGNARLTSAQRIQPPAVADQQAGFRFRFVVASQPSKIYGGSVFYFRRGTVNIGLEFVWEQTSIPARLANTLAKKLVARAG
jgi:hypothetical protein